MKLLAKSMAQRQGMAQKVPLKTSMKSIMDPGVEKSVLYAPASHGHAIALRDRNANQQLVCTTRQ